MDLALYREDPEKQAKGTPIYLGDSTFFIRRFGTPESKKALRDISNSVFGPLHKWTESDDAVLYGHWLAEYGVTGWENVSTSEGELIYSKSKARKIFNDKEYHLSLNAQLISDAMRFENFLYDAAEEDEKTLKKK